MSFLPAYCRICGTGRGWVAGQQGVHTMLRGIACMGTSSARPRHWGRCIQRQPARYLVTQPAAAVLNGQSLPCCTHALHTCLAVSPGCRPLTVKLAPSLAHAFANLFSRSCLEPKPRSSTDMPLRSCARQRGNCAQAWEQGRAACGACNGAMNASGGTAGWRGRCMEGPGCRARCNSGCSSRSCRHYGALCRLGCNTHATSTMCCHQTRR